MGEWCIDLYFLDLDTSWRWVFSFASWPLYLGKKKPGTHCIGGWVNHRGGLDDMENWKFLTQPGLELRPLGRPASMQSLYRLLPRKTKYVSSVGGGSEILIPEHAQTNGEKVIHLNRIDHARLSKVQRNIYIYMKTIENITMNWKQIWTQSV
jgi:hypothetical protein